MRIADLLERQRPVFSFEFFPPKTDEGHQTLRNTLEVLKDDEPNFVSVTYGAGGTTRNRTVEITKTIKRDFGIEAMAHLSCVGELRASSGRPVLLRRADPADQGQLRLLCRRRRIPGGAPRRAGPRERPALCQ